jgi:hypothetical protein
LAPGHPLQDEDSSRLAFRIYRNGECLYTSSLHDHGAMQASLAFTDHEMDEVDDNAPGHPVDAGCEILFDVSGLCRPSGKSDASDRLSWSNPLMLVLGDSIRIEIVREDSL